MDKMIRELSQRRKRHTARRRTIALLCVIVLLCTMNTLKRSANTLERIPMCGYAVEHVHSSDCYAGDVLVCGLAEHVHTDACYQQSPDWVELPSGLDIDDSMARMGDSVVDAGDLELSLDAGDFALVSDDVAPAPLASNAVDDAPRAFALGEGALVSQIIEALELNIALEEIVDIGTVDNGETENDLIGIERIEDDYRVWANRDFAQVQLALTVVDDIVVVNLVDGVAATAEAEQAPAEAQSDDEMLPAAEAPATEEATPAMADVPAGEAAIVDEAVSVDAIQIDGEALTTEETALEQTEVGLEEAETLIEETEVESEEAAIQSEKTEAQSEVIEAQSAKIQAQSEETEEQPARDEAQAEVTVVETEGQSDEIGEQTEEIEEETKAQSEATEEETAEQSEETEAQLKETEEETEAQSEETEAQPEETEEEVEPQPEETEEQSEETEEATEAQPEDTEVQSEATEGETEAQPEETEEEAEPQPEETEEQSEETEGETEAQPEDTEVQPEATEGETGAQLEEPEEEAEPQPEETEAQPEDTEEATEAQTEETEAQPEVTEEETEAQPVEFEEAIEAQPEETEEETGTQPEEIEETIEGQPEETGEETEAQPEQTEEAAEAQPEETEEETEAQPEQTEEEAEAQPEKTEEEAEAQPDDTDAEAEAQTEEEPEAQPEEHPTYTATVDLSEAVEYPLSLNVLIAGMAPEAETETEADVEEASAEEMAVEEAPAEANAETPEWMIEYDHALLDIVEADGDCLITPVASFEATLITADNGSRYALTLVNCALPEAEPAYPAQNFEGRTAYVKVAVSAPEGAFPEGTAMAVADVADDDTLENIEATVSEDFVEVKRVHAVDITFTDADGNEIEPLLPISVVMTVEEIEQDQDAVVVHVDSAGETEVVAQDQEAAAVQSEVAFSAESFSVYAVVVTQTIETKYIDAEGETWSITVGYGAQAGIPAGAKLAVEEVPAEDYMGQAEDALPETRHITGARFFDITILDADGQAVQPAEAVTVNMALADAAEGHVDALHFVENGVEVLPAEQNDEAAVVFSAEGFSVYGIVYTVDFHYGVDGREFEHHMVGGTVQSLRALLPVLGIIDDDTETGVDEVERFIQDIATVAFSDEALVKPVPVSEDITAGAVMEALDVEPEFSADLTDAQIDALKAEVLAAPDWALVSLKPFNTEETLTITLKNGETVTVRVTDASPNQFSVDVATWTSWGNRWGRFTSKYYGKDSTGNGIDGDRYPQTGMASGKDSNGNTVFNFGFTPVPNNGYEFAFWTYQQNGLYRQLSGITNATVIPNNPTDFLGYFTPKGKKLFIYQSEDTAKGSVNQSYGYSDWSSGATATANRGYQFIGWYDQSNRLISLERTFPIGEATESMVLTAKFIQPHQAYINVSVNDSNGGDVVAAQNGQEVSCLGDQWTQYNGQLAQTITARPKEGYTFCYWTLNGQPAFYDEALSNDPEKGQTPYFSTNDRLQAVFRKSTVIDANGNANSTIQVGTDKKEQFERWLKSLQNGDPLSADKTAKVYDYDNRIYQIDINAESARVDVEANIGVAFILDASNSMQFPASIRKTGKTLVLTQNNLNKAFPDESGPLYFISDPTNTSTMYRLYKENGTWYAVDASFSDPAKIVERRYVVDWDVFYTDTANRDNVPLAYPIYRDAGIGKRKDYLNAGLHDTINTLRSIVNQVNRDRYDIDVAYTMFCAYTPRQYEAGTNLPNGFVWRDFNTLKNSFTVDMGDTDGGTRQDLGLQDALAFNWDSIPAGQRYAILITDGAAVIGGKGITWDNKNYQGVQDNIVAQANALKAKGVKLITVGLSTRNVVGGSNVMKKIASDNLFFEAENGEDLQNIMYQIVQTVVKNATLGCQIVDEVDPAFYPVQVDGTPIQPGYYDKDGNRLNSQPGGEEWYEWIRDEGGNWKIVWHRQFVGWDPNDADPHNHPWHGSFYVKAKENFLGGNTISTNVGDCSVTEEAYIYPGRNWEFPNPQTKVPLPVPCVNVDELSLTHNDTQWTVYLGTEVDPLSQVRKLFDEVRVNEVATHTADGGHVVMSEAGDALYPVVASDDDGRSAKTGAVPETFRLANIVSLTDADWEKLVAGMPVTVSYGAYGHSAVGDIVVTLAQEAAQGEDDLTPSPHATTVKGQAVEKYTLTVRYVPAEEHDPDTGWHTTPRGSRGKATDEMQSVNTHAIHVFAKGLMLKKMDNLLEKTLTGAQFRLYRPATDTDTETADVMQINGAKCVPASGIFTVDGDGIAEIGDIPAGFCYLVETRAPEGYNIAAPMPVTLTIADSEKVYKPDANDANCPYDWTQTASLALGGVARRSNADWADDSSDVTPNSETATVYYRIPNNPGVRLPNTGGPGTAACYGAGVALVVLALALMLRRRSEY